MFFILFNIGNIFWSQLFAAPHLPYDKEDKDELHNLIIC